MDRPHHPTTEEQTGNTQTFVALVTSQLLRVKLKYLPY